MEFLIFIIWDSFIMYIHYNVSGILFLSGMCQKYEKEVTEMSSRQGLQHIWKFFLVIIASDYS